MGAKDTLLCSAFFAGLSSNFLRRFHIGQLQGTAQGAIMPVACSRYPLALRQQVVPVLVEMEAVVEVVQSGWRLPPTSLLDPRFGNLVAK